MATLHRWMNGLAAAVMVVTAPILLRAEIIDRIAATVGRQVITESQVAEEVRVTAFLEGKPPDWSEANRKRTLNRLIDQTLIRREVDATRFSEAPPEEGTKLMVQLKAEMKDLDESHAAKHLSETVVAKHLQWQVTFLRFVDYRFKPSIEVTEADLKDFYSTQVEEWKKQNKPVPSFEDARTDLEKLLTAKYVDQALDRWLGDQRTQTSIVFKGMP